MGKVAELFPSEAFQMLLPLLESYSQVYFSLQQLMTAGDHGKGVYTYRIAGIFRGVKFSWMLTLLILHCKNFVVESSLVTV